MSKNCQKLKQFFQKQKIAKNCHFFKKIAIGNLKKRKTIFGIKKKDFDNFSTFKWQFSGGSDSHQHVVFVELLNCVVYVDDV